MLHQHVVRNLRSFGLWHVSLAVDRAVVAQERQQSQAHVAAGFGASEASFVPLFAHSSHLFRGIDSLVALATHLALDIDLDHL